MAVLPVAVGCEEWEAGLSGYGRQLQLVVGVGAGSVACPALRRPIFPLHSALGQVPPLFLKSILSHGDQKPGERADVRAGFFVQQTQSSKNKCKSLWLFVLSRAECCSGFRGGNCVLKSCIFQCLEAAGRGSVRCGGSSAHRPLQVLFPYVSSSFSVASSPARPPYLRHPGPMLQGIKCSQCPDIGTHTVGAHCCLEASS